MPEEQDPDAAAMFDAAQRGALRMLNHLSRHAAAGSARAASPPDPRALTGAIAALQRIAAEIEKESASR